MTALVFLLGLFISVNVGANNAGSEMGGAYGAGLLRLKRATWLIALFYIIGAFLAGAPVVKTVGLGLVPEKIFRENLLSAVILVTAVAGLFEMVANRKGVPISTAHTMVCAIAGMGFYFNALNGERFLSIVGWWVVAPLITFFLNYLVNRFFYFRILHGLMQMERPERMERILGGVIVATGCYLAAAGGASSPAKAVGPLVGAGFLSPFQGAMFGAFGMAAGAVLLGGRVIETVGKRIIDLGVLRAILWGVSAATALFIFSIFGIPISVTQTVTGGLLGASCATRGFQETVKNEHVLRILGYWIASPILILGITYFLVAFINRMA